MADAVLTVNMPNEHALSTKLAKQIPYDRQISRITQDF